MTRLEQQTRKKYWLFICSLTEKKKYEEKVEEEFADTAYE